MEFEGYCVKCRKKQTIKNGERYITDRLKQYETEVLGAEEKALDLELKLFEDLRKQTCAYVERLQKLADTVAQIDCLTALAHVAQQRHYRRPTVTEARELVIKEGKHPVLAETLVAEFVSNDIELRDERGDIIVITGHGDRDLARQAFDLDASAFFNKPLDTQALEKEIQRIEKEL